MSRLSVSRLASLSLLSALAVTGAIGVSASSSAASAAQPLHTVTIGGVSLDVPASWHTSTAKGAGHGCIVATGVKAPAKDRIYGVDDCQLRVLTGSQLNSRFSSPDRFFYSGEGDPAQCIRDGQSRGWATTAATDTRVGPAEAEYRRLGLPCATHSVEQWFLAGPSAVLIQRTSANPTTEKAARAAVANARVPAAGVGYARSYTGVPESASGTSVTLEPARLYYDDLNQATATYALDRSLRVDVAHAKIEYFDGDGQSRSLTAAQLVGYCAHGFPKLGADDVPALITQSTTGKQIDKITVVSAHRPR